MSDKRFQGYRGAGKAVLERCGVGVWSEVDVESSSGRFTGLILPRSETSDDKHIVLKLENGYNVGIAADSISNISKIDASKVNPSEQWNSSPSIAAST